MLSFNDLLATREVEELSDLAGMGRCLLPENRLRFCFPVIGQGGDVVEVHDEPLFQQNLGTRPVHGVRIQVMVFFYFIVAPGVVVQRPQKGVIVSIVTDNFIIVNLIPKGYGKIDDLLEFKGGDLPFPSQELGVMQITVSHEDSLDFLDDSPEAGRFAGQVDGSRIGMIVAGIAQEIPAVIFGFPDHFSFDRIVVIVIEGCPDLFVATLGRTHEAGFEKRTSSSPGAIPFPGKQMRVLLYKPGKGGFVRDHNGIMDMIGHGTKGENRNAVAPGNGAVYREENQIIVEGVKDDSAADCLLAYMVNLSWINFSCSHDLSGIPPVRCASARYPGVFRNPSIVKNIALFQVFLNCFLRLSATSGFPNHPFPVQGDSFGLPGIARYPIQVGVIYQCGQGMVDTGDVDIQVVVEKVQDSAYPGGDFLRA